MLAVVTMEDVTDSSALLSAASLSNLGTEVENIEDVAQGWGWGEPMRMCHKVRSVAALEG